MILPVSGRPPGAGGVTDHGALSGLLDDDHTQYALLAGRAGGQTLKGGSGASELLQLESTAHATKGDVQIVDGSQFRVMNKYGNVIGQVAPVATTMLLLRPVAGGDPASAGRKCVDIAPQWTAGASSLALIGLSGNALISGGAYTGLSVYGLDFLAVVAGGSYSNVVGCKARGGGTSFLASTIATVDQIRAGFLVAYKAGSVVTSLAGFHAEDQGQATAASVYGLLVDDITAGTDRYLAWLGPSTRRFSVNAGTPGAGQTMVYIAEGVTPTVRRLQHMDPGAGGVNFAGGEKVCILV